MASIGEVGDTDILDPRDLEDLYSWIDAAPLSRPKKHIARDFSDGVSVAEIVHFYMPRMVELHNYVNANNAAQKKINWNMLNRKVFVKLNLKLSEKIVDNVIETKSGAIEQVLWDLRKKIIELNPKTISKNLIRSNTSNQLRSKQPSPGYSEAKVGKRSPSAVMSMSQPSRIPTKSILNTMVTSSHSAAPKKVAAVIPSQNPNKETTGEKSRDGISYTAGLKDELTQFGNNVSTNASYVAPHEGERQDRYDKSGVPVHSGSVDLNANSENNLPPAHLIYKGHKMVPSMLLDIKNRQHRDLELIVNSLQKKVNFLDNLIQLKDNRIEDLTRQLHSLKGRFQEFTQTKIPDL